MVTVLADIGQITPRQTVVVQNLVITKDDTILALVQRIAASLLKDGTFISKS